MKANSLRDLYVEQLKDLYDAEHQLIKSLPKIAEASSSEELRRAFEEHLEKTRQHAQRIEQIFEGMGQSPKEQKCKGMEGLRSEEHTSELQSPDHLVCRLLLEKKKKHI